MNITAHKIQSGVSRLKGVKNTIAIASGKGGVGKSTTTVNLALALSSQGAKVGILDADIYGPSQPHLLNLSGQQPESPDGKHLTPLENYGIQCMSMGNLVAHDQAMIWRGPMVSSALQQLARDTQWQDLDYLFIDLPPGTGDIQLTLVQKIPVTAAVIVTTPQDLALLDVKRAIQMFRKVEMPVLGVIENMSTHTCSACGHTDAIFGCDGAAKMAAEYDVNFLGSLPLSREIREQADNGKPTVIASPDSAEAKQYIKIAQQIASEIDKMPKDYAGSFPKVVIES